MEENIVKLQTYEVKLLLLFKPFHCSEQLWAMFKKQKVTLGIDKLIFSRQLQVNQTIKLSVHLEIDSIRTSRIPSRHVRACVGAARCQPSLQFFFSCFCTMWVFACILEPESYVRMGVSHVKHARTSLVLHTGIHVRREYWENWIEPRNYLRIASRTSLLQSGVFIGMRMNSLFSLPYAFKSNCRVFGWKKFVRR